MTGKKPYSPPQVFRVELDHEQAILSVCSLMATTVVNRGNARCQFAGTLCKNVNSSAGFGDSAARVS